MNLFKMVAEVASGTKGSFAHGAGMISDTTMLFEVTKVDLPARLRERFAALFALVGHLVGRGVDIPVVFNER